MYTQTGLKPIVDVKLGERVLAHDGRLHKVNHLFSRNYSGPVVTIKATGLPPVSLTSNHRVFTAKTKSGKQSNHSLVDEKADTPAGLLTTGSYLLFPVVDPKEQVDKPSWASDAYLNLAGFYLSEGHVAKSNRSMCRIGFTLNSKNQHDINLIVSLLKELVPNNKINVSTKHENNTATDVVVHNKELADKLVADFGRGAKNKRLPDWVLYGDSKTCALLLRGIFRGDRIVVLILKNMSIRLQMQMSFSFLL